MNKEVEMKVLKAKYKIENKLMRKQQMEAENIPPTDNILKDRASDIDRAHLNTIAYPLQCYNSVGFQQRTRKLRNIDNLPPFSSNSSMPETEVRSGDAADNSGNVVELKKESQETCVSTYELVNMDLPQIKTDLCEIKSFEEDLKMFIYDCQEVYSQSQTPDFYCDKLKSLKEIHIQELLKEKYKLDIKFQQAQKEQKENRHLIIKRLNVFENMLCSSTVSNKFSEFQNDEILEKEKRVIKVIKSKLIDSVDCSIVNDLLLTEVSSVSDSRSKKEIINILNEVNLENNRFSNELNQTHEELKTVKKELEGKINIIRQHTHNEQERISEINKLKSETSMLKVQFWQTQEELKDVKKEFNDKVLNIIKTKDEEVDVLRIQLAGAQNELTVLQNEAQLHSSIQFLQQQSQYEERRMADKEVKALQNQLVETQCKLEAVTKELNNTIKSYEQNIQRQQKISEIEFQEIRKMLVKQLGVTDESYVKEVNSQGIVSDIRRLIKDKVQLLDEAISKTVSGTNILKVTENEVHLVVAIACFLKVIPFSASANFIYSFVAQIDNDVSYKHVECLLKKFPTLFKEESFGTGSSNMNWRYLDLKPIINI